jgi:hypothetical protein
MMNSNPKFDLHPDAENLNAFAEQALPEGERGEIVAHLAECGRCREVVFLARKAAGMEPELELVAAAAASPSLSHSVEKKEPRFRRWRIAWIPAAALGTVFSVAYIVHARHEEIVAEQARAARETAAHSVEMASAPQAPAIGMPAVPLPPAASATPALKSPTPPLSNMASRQIVVAAAPPAASEASAMANASGNGGAVQPGVSGGGSPAMDAAAEYDPLPALAEKRQEQELAAKALRSRSMETEKSSQASAGGPGKTDQVHGVVAAAAPMAQLEAAPARSGSAEVGERRKESGVFTLSKNLKAALPSGLAALSTAMTPSDMLAVDGAGDVFLSEDAGGHWVGVAKQWSGRAVAVRLRPITGASAGAASLPARIFEIVNDQGLVWVSTDGKIWKAK